MDLQHLVLELVQVGAGEKGLGEQERILQLVLERVREVDRHGHV